MTAFDTASRWWYLGVLQIRVDLWTSRIDETPRLAFKFWSKMIMHYFNLLFKWKLCLLTKIFIIKIEFLWFPIPKVSPFVSLYLRVSKAPKTLSIIISKNVWVSNFLFDLFPLKSKSNRVILINLIQQSQAQENKLK